MLRVSAKQNKSGVLFILKLVVKEQKIKLKVNKPRSCTNQQHKQQEYKKVKRVKQRKHQTSRPRGKQEVKPKMRH